MARRREQKRVLGIAGSPKVNGVSASGFLLEQALNAAQEEGAQTKMARLVDYQIVPCDGCGDCMNKTPCHLFRDPEDRYAELFKLVKWADAYIFASPVYALSLPATWKHWLDRCEPASGNKFDYQYYNYEVAADVKGKAFQGKVAAQIVTSGGIGQEWALASLMPLWTNVKLSVVASVGLSLIEYDEQPGIRSKPWGKGVAKADFAIEIARQVGKRVTQAIGFSTFNVCGRSPRLAREQSHRDVSGSLAMLQDVDGQSLDWPGSDGDCKGLLLVAGGQATATEAKKRFERIVARGYPVDARLVAAVEPLPEFVKPEFVVRNIKAENPGTPMLIDWDREFSQALGLSSNVEPYILLISREGHLLRSISGTFALNEVHGELSSALELTSNAAMNV